MAPLLVGLRWAQFVDLALLFGAPLTALLWGERRVGQIWRPVMGMACITGLACTGLYFAVALASMAASAIGDLDHGLVITMLTGSALGWSVIARAGALVVLAGCVMAGRSVALLPVTLLSAVAVGSLAWGGHGAASQGWLGVLRLAGDMAHLWCALAWLGALMLLAARLWRARPGEDAMLALLARQLSAFSLIGSVLVTVLVVSGTGNLLFLAGPDHWIAMVRQPYGQWMLAKLVMAALMLLAAAQNRFRLVPALSKANAPHAQSRAIIALRYSVSIEMALALGVMGCVAMAGTLDPGV